MTDGDALLAAILANPDEDTPRLAFADWLEENGDHDRAEFIRVQVERARLAAGGEPPSGPQAAELRAREQVLLGARGFEWLAPLRGPGGPLRHPGAHGQFRRGFVEVVWMPASWFLVCADALFRSVPVRELRVTETTLSALAGVASADEAVRLAGLDLSDRKLGDEAVGAISAGKLGPALRVLRLRGCGITDRGAHWLTREGRDWPLRELDVSHNPISREGAAALRRRYGDAVRAVGTGTPA